MHDPTRVLLGNTTSSIKEIDNRAGTIAAGLAVRLSSADAISVAAADGSLLGISMGRSMSDTARTAIARKGLRVPVRLTAAFTPVVGAQVYLSDTTGAAIASGAGATGVNATYATAVLSGIPEEGGAEVPVALIDFPGGL